LAGFFFVSGADGNGASLRDTLNAGMLVADVCAPLTLADHRLSSGRID